MSTKTIPLELNTVNNLYLELSQVATAVTAKEISLRFALENANGLCRSMLGILNRPARDSDWALLRKRLKAGLALQHKAMYPERYDANGNELDPTK